MYICKSTMSMIYNRLPADLQEVIDKQLLKEKNIYNKKVFDDLRLRFKRMAVYNNLTAQDLKLQDADEWYYGIFEEEGGFDEEACDGNIYDTCHGCGWTAYNNTDCICEPLDWKSCCVKKKH